MQHLPLNEDMICIKTRFIYVHWNLNKGSSNYVSVCTFNWSLQIRKKVKQQSAVIHSVSSLMELTFRVITYRLLFPLLNKYIQIYLKMIW